MKLFTHIEKILRQRRICFYGHLRRKGRARLTAFKNLLVKGNYLTLLTETGMDMDEQQITDENIEESAFLRKK